MTRVLISGSEGKMGNYLRAIEAAGGMGEACYAPRVSHQRYDALLLCGGGDLSPALFGGVPGEWDCGVDPVRESSDIQQIAAFAAAGKPVLGICRGMQMLNVVLGGGLVQDLGALCVIHSGHDHLAVACGGVMERLFGHSFFVNSAHHQAVGDLAPGFQVTLRGSDGTIEGIEHECLPILGVQWHPERHEKGQILFDWFVDMAKKRSKH